MAKLLVHESTGIREFELMDEEVRIGRELDNTLRIPDPSVSRHHAVLRRTPQGYMIQDKQSANGIVIKGKKVTEAALADGDEFLLGQVQITFRNHDNTGAAVSPVTPNAKSAEASVPVLSKGHESKTTDPSKTLAHGSTSTQGGSNMSQQSGNQKMISKPDANPLLALLISIFIYGAGCLYNGQAAKWTVIFLFTVIGWILCFLPGLFIWVLGVIDSYQTAQRLCSGESIPENEYSMPLLYNIVKILDKSATCSRA